LMPFLFVWTAMIAIPMVMATGAIGILHYLATYFPKLTGVYGQIAAVGIVCFVVILLYRDIQAIARLTTVLCGIMFLTVGMVILAALTHFDPRLAFDYPPDAFRLGRPFFAGLGAALIIALYDYAGYNTTAYMAAEIKNPGRVVPKSIIGSILIIMCIYL